MKNMIFKSTRFNIVELLSVDDKELLVSNKLNPLK